MTQALATLKAMLVAALLAGLLFGGFWLYRQGYHTAEAVGAAKYERLVTDTERASNLETIRQQAANARARVTADVLQAQLTQAREDREAAIQELTDAAKADPHAGRVCLGADSVRRITEATPPGPAGKARP